MTDLLHKPRRTSTALSSGIIRMTKEVAVGDRVFSTTRPPTEFWTRPGWVRPMLGVVEADVAILRGKGTPYAPYQRIRLANTVPETDALPDLDPSL